MSNAIPHATIHQQVQNWLQEVVIGLNLCPFAAKPFQQNQIRTVVSDCHDPACLLETLQAEFQYLQSTPVDQLETTLVVVTNQLQNFDDYNQFLDLVDALIQVNNWEGIFQVASFHPNYQFAGTMPEDDENLTNRAPYPIFHLLRETSLEKALARYPHPERIPQQNIERVSALTPDEVHRLFPYIFE